MATGLLAAIGVVGVVGGTPTDAQTPATLNVAIPAYIFSDDLRGWEAIIDRASVTPVAVINPRNGPNVFAGTRCDGFTPPNDPGTGPNLSGLRSDDDFQSPRFPNDPKLVTTQTNYLTTLEQHFVRRSQALSANGIGMYGYVWSNTNGADPGCRRTPAIISDEIDLYRQRYGIGNVFFDDAASTCPNDTRRAMADVARSKGARIIMNPGTSAESCVANEADVIVNFEGTPTSYFAARDAVVANAALLRGTNANVKIWHIVYGATDSDVDAVVAQAQSTADYLYITDDTTQAHGCDRGNSNFDALFGTWPIIRQDIPGCSSRSNGSARSWSSVVDAITRPVVTTATTATTTATSLAPQPSTSTPTSTAQSATQSTTQSGVVVPAAATTTQAANSAPPIVIPDSRPPLTTTSSTVSGATTVLTLPPTTTRPQTAPSTAVPTTTIGAARVPATTTTRKPTVTTAKKPIAKKPLTKKSSAKKPAAKKPAAKNPTRKTVVKNVVKSRTRPVATKTVAKRTTAKKR
jgi:hypothetical protein